jgi:hypothetical protein
MDTAKSSDHRTWGVRCGDGEVLWVDDEAAAHRLLVSLVGAEHIVRRGDGASGHGQNEPPTS